MTITKLKLDEIKLREDNQRKELTDIADLMESIKNIGLINPIVVDDEYRLIAGGRRLEAFKQLRELEGEKWDTIGITLFNDLSPIEKALIEYDENVRRVNLPWKEMVLAHGAISDKIKEHYPDITEKEVASKLGYNYTNHLKVIAVYKALKEGHAKVNAASGYIAAYNIVTKEEKRKQDNIINELHEDMQNMQVFTPKNINKDSPEDEITDAGESVDAVEPDDKATAFAPKSVIINTDFCEWVSTYKGERFNLIHCDFPYGINHGKSDMGNAKLHGSYVDSEDIYWRLIEAMLTHRDNIMLPSCHIIFWFSMKHYMRTIEVFKSLAPEIEINYTPLIWHKTDNKGIIRDVKRTPRHVYETALFMSRGDRNVIECISDTYGAPTQKTEAKHLSEKPVPMLKHFFRLCVDEYSKVLDPTCGSGNALVAADTMNARKVLGIELDPTFARNAQENFDTHFKIKTLANIGV